MTNPTRTCSIDNRPAHRRAKIGDGYWCSACYEWSRKRSWADPSARTRHQTADPDRGCSVDGCGQPHKGAGYCSLHYQQGRSGMELKLRHLYLGTQAENMSDAMEAGHTLLGRTDLQGTQNGNALLTEAQVAEARAAWVKGSHFPRPGSTRALALRYGVAQCHDERRAYA